MQIKSPNTVSHTHNYFTFVCRKPQSDDRIHKALGEILERLNNMSAELDTLTAEVAETGTVVDSAIALIEGLAQQIRDLANDPAALAQLAADLDAKTNALAAAVSANTSTPV
jgi:chromosome segregation ATPase